MKKAGIISAVAAAVAIAMSAAYADEMENCKVMKDGVVKLEEVSVPKGQCEKINQGDLSGLPADLKEKIEAALKA